MKKIHFQINNKKHIVGVPDITVALLVILILYDALLGYTNTLNPACYIVCVVCACGVELAGATRITWRSWRFHTALQGCSSGCR